MNRSNKKKTLLAFLGDFFLITSSFFLAVYLKRKNLQITKEYLYLLFVLYSIWFISSTIIGKFKLIRPKKLMKGLRLLYRSFLYMVAILFLLLFLFRLFNYSRFIVFATLIIYFFLETAGFVIFYLLSGELSVIEIDENKHEIFDNEKEDIQIDIKGRKVKESLKSKLKETYLDHIPKLYDFVDAFINSNAIKASNSVILNTRYSESIACNLNNELEFILNLQPINNIKRINKFFIVANSKLLKGGYLVGLFETIEQRKKRKFSKYPTFILSFLFFFDFIYKRMFPKLPILKKIYFMISKGEKRVISKCEILGRLSSCGFRLIKIREIDSKLHFIVKKVANPLETTSPSYGLIFKQRRFGENGEIIHIYKFRTMYPFAEYLRSFVLKNHGYASSGSGIGKVENDFRVTAWGKFLRKYWLDELPQLINVLRGEMKLVGVRPLGKTFLSEYPEDMKAERLKVKPGCIPPYVVHIHNSVEEYINADRKYLASYKKHPIWSDIKYFFWGVYNIVVGRIKSA